MYVCVCGLNLRSVASPVGDGLPLWHISFAMQVFMKEHISEELQTLAEKCAAVVLQSSTRGHIARNRLEHMKTDQKPVDVVAASDNVKKFYLIANVNEAVVNRCVIDLDGDHILER